MNNQNENNLPATTGEKSISEMLQNSVLMKNSDKLSQLMLDNIEKIQANPNYIPQAEAIVNNMKSMIDLAKTEIEIFKVAIVSAAGGK